MTPHELRRLLRLRRPAVTGRDRVLRRTLSVPDLREAARRRLPRAIFDYLEGGADQEVTILDNVERFSRYRWFPQALRGTASPGLGCSVFGEELPLPIGLAPTGYTRLFHSDGELAVARAAASLGIPYSVATLATTALEEVAAASRALLWFQLYTMRDWEVTRGLVQRAESAGYRVLQVTVDTAVAGRRTRDLRNGLTIPPTLTARTLFGIAGHVPYWVSLVRGRSIGFANFASDAGPSAGNIASITERFEPAISWDQVARLREIWKGAMVIKGPLGAQDVVRAVELGCDGVYLSNHGGRQLDQVAHPLDLLVAARRAVGRKTTILLDSGIRCGADVAIALACGADYCLVGRPYLYGLAAAGQAGVEFVIGMIAEELGRTLQLLGLAGVADLKAAGEGVVRYGGSPASRPGDTGDFGVLQ
ncbi:MAG: alpha-hydroxy acid oxidase [Candidatus Dormibacteria bacterium]